MKTTVKLQLVKEARKAGGDRYEGPVEGEPRPLVLYIPQKISRGGGAPCTIIKVTFEPV